MASESAMASRSASLSGVGGPPPAASKDELASFEFKPLFDAAVLPSLTVEAFTARLAKFGVDTSGWTRGTGHKTVESLLHEAQEGESVLVLQPGAHSDPERASGPASPGSASIPPAHIEVAGSLRSAQVIRLVRVCQVLVRRLEACQAGPSGELLEGRGVPSAEPAGSVSSGSSPRHEEYNPTTVRVLVEDRQVFSDGMSRPRGMPLSEKMKGPEQASEAAVRAIQEELQVHDGLGSAVRVVTDSPLQRVRVKTEPSHSYPGLLARYEMHSVEVCVEGLPEDSGFTTDEKTDGENMIKHFWSWVPLSEVV